MFQKGNKIAVKHGLSKTRLYRIWHSMYCRCNYSTTNGYENYGGRGVKICDEWKDFLTFYNWAIKNGYEENKTIDRNDTNGNYEPQNCKWSTIKEQSNNKRNNVIILFRGEKKTAKQWCEEYNISQTTFNDRRKRGWTIEQALTISTKGKNKKVK